MSTRRLTRSTTSAASSRSSSSPRSSSAINFAPVPNEGALVLGLAAIALAAGVAFYLRQRRATTPALRPRRRGPPDLLGRGVCGDHRVRVAHGRGIRQSAVPPERARILDAGGRCVDPAGRSRHGARRAPLGQARGRVRGPVHAARRIRVPAPGVPDHAAPLEGGHLLLAGCARVRVHRYRSRARRHAGVALADRLGPGDPRRDGVRNSRSPARSRRRRSCSRSSERC